MRFSNTCKIHNNAPFVSRRRFLRTAPFAALGAATLAGHAQANVSESAELELLDVHHLDICRFGAVGDGQTDDTEAIRKTVVQAKKQRIGTVFLPAGVYMISGTIRLPSNLTLQGQGPGLTTIKAVEDTLFDKFKPNPRTQDIRQRRTMITTEAVSTVREQITRHINIRDITLDWNNCPTERYGHSVILADSCDHVLIDNVYLINCLPSDHPRNIDDMSGSAFRCEGIMFSNARHGMMNRCSLTDSGYRPLSVSYNSKQIYYANGIIIAKNPVWRHVFCENHGDAMPRDHTFERSQIIFLNSTFILEGGTGQDGICSHTGITHVENCDFYIKGGTSRFSAFLRAFDGSRDCQYINNRFHSVAPIDDHFFKLFTTSRSGQREGPNENITFQGNIVRIDIAPRADGKTDSTQGFLVDLPDQATDVNVRIAENHAKLTFHGRVPGELITINNATGVVVANNTLDVRVNDENTLDQLPSVLTLHDCNAIHVANNVLTGNYRQGITIDDSERLIITGNDFSDATEEAITGLDPECRIIANNNLM